VQNSKASRMFDSQPLGRVNCSNYIDYNLILLLFKGNVLINFVPIPLTPYVLVVVTPSTARVGTFLMDAPLIVFNNIMYTLQKILQAYNLKSYILLAIIEHKVKY